MKNEDIISLGYKETDPMPCCTESMFIKSEKQVRFIVAGNSESGFVLRANLKTHSGYVIELGSTGIRTKEDLEKLEHIYRRLSVVCEEQ
jgi:hypothetical protein